MIFLLRRESAGSQNEVAMSPMRWSMSIRSSALRSADHRRCSAMSNPTMQSRVRQPAGAMTHQFEHRYVKHLGASHELPGDRFSSDYRLNTTELFALHTILPSTQTTTVSGGLCMQQGRRDYSPSFASSLCAWSSSELSPRRVPAS
jgi:hypothetical protein